MSESNAPKSLKVWDPVVRIGHWLIVGGVLTAYFSGDEAQNIHVIAGYTVAAVVVFRLLWGFIGTRHARFSDFVRGPGAIIEYLKSLPAGRAKRYLGHNPAGGAMIIALLFSLFVTTGTGLALLAIEEGQGPLKPFISQSVGSSYKPVVMLQSDRKPFASGYDDDDDDKGEHERGGHQEDAREELLEGLHKAFTYLTLFLAGLHIIGVVVSSRMHKENLVRAMITGRKINKD